MIKSGGNESSFLNNFKGVFKMIKREMKKYKVLAMFEDKSKMYLQDAETGAELIIEAVDTFAAYCEAVEWIYATSNYSKEDTEKWIDTHPLVFERCFYIKKKLLFRFL